MDVKYGEARNSIVELFRIVSMLLVLISSFQWMVSWDDLHPASVQAKELYAETIARWLIDQPLSTFERN